MSELVADCPRCGANEMTFDLKDQIVVGSQYEWQVQVEAFCICRKCWRSTIFVLSQKNAQPATMAIMREGLSKSNYAVNRFVNIEGYINVKDIGSRKPPEHVPENIAEIFQEGSTSMSVECFNAAGTMFRLCLDLSTGAMLPNGEEEGLNAKARRDLGLRLQWLLDKKILPEALRELSSCVKDDGNDGAHRGTLGMEDAEDLQDFTYAFLERVYTEPKKIQLANERRAERRKT